MNSKPTFDFDVSSEYSLDILAQEILDCLHNSSSKCIIDIRGPAGGNTNVKIYTLDFHDVERVKVFLEKSKIL